MIRWEIIIEAYIWREEIYLSSSDQVAAPIAPLMNRFVYRSRTCTSFLDSTCLKIIGLHVISMVQVDCKKYWKYILFRREVIKQANLFRFILFMLFLSVPGSRTASWNGSGWQKIVGNSHKNRPKLKGYNFF